MEVGICYNDKHVGWFIKDIDLAFCCKEMTHVYRVHGQIHIGIRLGKPAFVISCPNAFDIIGQHCPFCGEKLTERSDNDENT